MVPGLATPEPNRGGDPSPGAGLPPPGGAHWALAEFPPDSAVPSDVDLASLIAEVNEKLPYLLAYQDPTRPGMHQTPTIDFAIVISGEIWLELDEGEVHLKPGDCVVQRGTMHAWRNRSDRPCVMSFVEFGVGARGGS